MQVRPQPQCRQDLHAERRLFSALGASGAINGAVVISDTASVGQQILDVKGTAALPLTFTPTSLTFPAQTVATTSASANRLPSPTTWPRR